VANAVYFIQDATSPYVEIYITSNAGVPRRQPTNSDIATMISAAISGGSSIQIVADIAARNALTPTATVQVYVIDASADTTVASGGAYYLYNTANSTWIKTSEAESMDVSLTWANISGKPTSTAAQIDTAVTNTHTHTNKTELDKITQNANGYLLYDAKLPYTGWETLSW
jgi:hypothetical protein